MTDSRRPAEKVSGLQYVLSDSSYGKGSVFCAPECPHFQTDSSQLVFLDARTALSGRRTAVCRMGEGGYKGVRGAFGKMVFDCPVSPAALDAAFAEGFSMLKQGGVFAVTADIGSISDIKALADKYFGTGGIINEIILYYKKNGVSRRCFSKRHETLLLYGKGDYKLDTLACGIKRGVTRRNHMKRGIDEAGRAYVYMNSDGKEYRYYEDEIIPFDDVWELEPGKAFYGTELRPDELFRRLLLCTTDEGDTAAFLYCADACAEIAARLSRDFTAYDCCAASVHLLRRRLLESGCDFTVYNAFPADNGAIVDLNIVNHGSETELYLNGYSHCGLSSTDAVDYWAAGHLNGDTFVVEDFSQRTAMYPALRGNMRINAENGGLIYIVDARGNEKYVSFLNIK